MIFDESNIKIINKSISIFEGGFEITIKEICDILQFTVILNPSETIH